LGSAKFLIQGSSPSQAAYLAVGTGRLLRTVKDPGPNVRTRGSRRRNISRKPADMGRPLTRLHHRRQPRRSRRSDSPAGGPHEQAIQYAGRHRDHPPMPALIVNMGRLNRNIGPRRLRTVIRRIRSYGDHI
jgi:hypothetical protein